MNWFNIAVLYAIEHLVTIIIVVLAFLFFARLLRDQERASTSLGWIVSIVLVPFVAIPAYLIFGGRKLAARVKHKQKLSLRDEADQLDPATDLECERMLISAGISPARTGNATEFISNDVEMYDRLCALIESAEHSIDINTFIFGTDEVGRDIAARLSAKARAGVSVRLLVDALGSFRARLFLLRSLRHAGVEVGVFMRFLTLQRKWSANLRNHRKLALFDGSVALTGGFNIAAEYIGPKNTDRRDSWIDTALLVRGPVVGDMVRLFEDDWAFATGTTATPKATRKQVAVGDETLQFVPSGPDVDGDPFYEAVLSKMYRAKRRIWMVTPYFVPDEGLMRALMIHARLGLDVRVCVPLKSNHRIADLARARYLRRLQQRGARIFVHPHRMIHAKQLIVDDNLAVCGSANFDLRSFYLNFEESLFTYEGQSIAATETWFESLSQDCDELTFEEPGYWKRWAEDISWLLSPLL